MGNFLSVLKAIGKGLTKALPFVGAVAQISPAIGGKFGSIVEKVLFGVTSVENAATIFGQAKSGPEKLAASITVIIQGLKDAETLSGLDIVDNSKFERGLQSLASGTADILDSIKHKS